MKTENKQYRLKRWYPSLKKTVEVGCIITKIYTCGGYHYRGSDNEGVIFYVSGSQCENNPDFWELIEEEKPKPLFTTKDGVEVFDGDKYIYIYDLQIYTTKACKENAYLIGEIRFKHEENADKYIEENKPKPLFTTEDGVEISDLCQTVYLIHPKTFIRQKSALGYFSADDLDNNKLFFHESNADEYIWRNKRVFSYEDIREYFECEGKFYDVKSIAKERSEQ